ncbi:MAG: molybdopterin-guanine dinucleotide biosynthesis protein B [Deltaproteobacteria bacterium]|nr:MAG: molybdopterin-guanine dinucleotide biosynthesis protein B [Deltaproteobacteria bacterium]
MKAVGIVGFKKSGKTALIMRLSQELSTRGYKVAAIKHTPLHICFPETDSSKFKEHAPFVAAIGPQETEVIIKGEKRIEDILAYCDSDIVLIEGFKKEKTFPKIVCVKDEGDKNELFDGLQLFTAGFDAGIADFIIANDEHIKDMAALVIERSFKLPSLNCGHCGYESCYELAKEIVGGKESVDTCVSLHPPVSIKVDGTMFPLNPFTSELFRNTILAMLSSLKGYKKGAVEIEIP